VFIIFVWKKVQRQRMRKTSLQCLFKGRLRR
jgi:hypothetical protein